MTRAQTVEASRRVLVVEDDYFIAKGLVRQLRASGIDVLGPAATVADALALIGVEPLNGAVLDINLRGDFVFPVADALIERGVPFIFATGYGSATIPERYSGVTRCEKPSEPEVILSALFGP